MANWIADLLKGGRNASAQLTKGASARGHPHTEQQRAVIDILRSRARNDAQKRVAHLNAYKDYVKVSGGGDLAVIAPGTKPPPSRPLYIFPTKMPVCVSDEAKVAIAKWRDKCPGAKLQVKADEKGFTVSLIATRNGDEVDIATAESVSGTDPRRVNIKDNGVSVLVNNGMLVFRLQYPSTAASVSSAHTRKQGDLAYRLRTSFTKLGG